MGGGAPGGGTAEAAWVLERLATPPEDLLSDPAALLDHPRRVQALVEGLRLAGRDTARYESDDTEQQRVGR